MRVAIRGYAGGARLFEDTLEITEEGLHELVAGLAEKHAKAMAAHKLHMIEIEFPDEPDEDARFFRMGTDPGGMVLPVRVL